MSQHETATAASTGNYRGFQYTLRRQPNGRVILHVEGNRAPAKQLFDSFNEARNYIRRWADLALAQMRPEGRDE